MASADTPKYTDLMNWIREQILSGEFTIGMRLPSENELGKKILHKPPDRPPSDERAGK